ncbi:MAG: hypothetical protein D6689_21330 [Deltaproteobacteria bacterium]|nr:MAG: hypothetical protein D6689_21330 [Deltaproteobacteria bacterium]
MAHTVRIAAAAAALCLAAQAAPARAQKKAPARRPADPAASARIDLAAARAALSAADVDAAAAAAARLGQVRDPRALDALLDALAAGVHPAVAEAALAAIARHAAPRSVDVVRHYARHRSPRVRAAAVAALGAVDDARAAAAVLAALRDGHADVRAAAAKVVAARRLRAGIEPLLALLRKGDEAAADALATLADPELARAVAEQLGAAPDAVLARCLGAILMRPDFKPEAARVEVVRALGKIAGTEAIEQLTTYIASTPEKPPRLSRREAEAIVEQRLAEGQ